MTCFPELQHALVVAGRARYSRRARAWRLVRPVLAAAACAAVAALVVLVAGARGPEQEVPSPAATPTGALEQDFGVFRRPAIAADALPAAEQFKSDWMRPQDAARFDPSRSRLVARDGDTQVFVVGVTAQGHPAVDAVVFWKGEAHFGAGRAIDDLQPDDEVIGVTGADPSGARPAAFVAAVADGIDHVTVAFGDRSAQPIPVRDNGVYAPLDRWPVSVSWLDDGGARHTAPLWYPGSHQDGRSFPQLPVRAQPVPGSTPSGGASPTPTEIPAG